MIKLLTISLLLCVTSYDVVKLFKPYSGMVEQGYNRGKYIDICNRKAGVPLGSPYCASCMALTLDKGRLRYATQRRASARAYITPNAIRAVDVWRGKAAIPVPSLAIWIRKGGGHIGMVTAVAGDTLKGFEFNTSPATRGSQWNGAWSGFRNRSIARDCAPTNAYRITHFVPLGTGQ